MKRIKEWDSKTPLVLVCRPGLGEFFLEYGLADEVIAVDKRKDGDRALKELARHEWDTVFVPHMSVRTALWIWRLRAKTKVGFKTWWNFFAFDKRVVKPMDFPDALRQLSLLTAVDSRFAEMFGGEDVQALRNLDDQNFVSFTEPFIPEWASMRVIPARSSEKLVFLAPGSVWNTKRWTAGGYTDLAKLLIERGYEVELVGSPAERALCEEIAARVPGVRNRAGQTTMSDLVKRLSQGMAIVSNDSGAMHAAAAADLPTVAVFGPTVLGLGFRPWQNKAVVVQRELKCRPCGKHGHSKCPIGTHECMEKISAREVMTALEGFLR